ncbi:MAG: tRNA epoxyqueuosine(34) reductase QueG, partial [Deltaproteobacteria bacterium]|nr:tRNA epoxyqueuosine(34) reductase QueG [Deltaproteobacteria bacterium]
MSLLDQVRARARELGFAAACAVPAGPALSMGAYQSWLAGGMAGAMEYLARHAPLKADTRVFFPQGRTMLVLTHPYGGPEAEPPEAGPSKPEPPETRQQMLHGVISRYAWGRDYHDVLGEKLSELAGYIARISGRNLESRAFVDSSPVLEREWAVRAGLGWLGRNACLIAYGGGSWLFICGLLLDMDPALLEAPPPGTHLPPTGRHCGSCRACREACPTGAIVADGVVDSRRCLSYLTIELRGPVPEDLRAGLGNRVFGCDICQEVCPWNRKPRPGTNPAAGREFQAENSRRVRPRLSELLALDEEEFRRLYRDTPLWRPRRRGLLRNAALALGNQVSRAAGQQDGNEAGGSGAGDSGAGDSGPDREELLAEARTALSAALGDHEPLVRGAAAWALGRLPRGEGRV